MSPDTLQKLWSGSLFMLDTRQSCRFLFSIVAVIIWSVSHILLCSCKMKGNRTKWTEHKTSDGWHSAHVGVRGCSRTTYAHGSPSETALHDFRFMSACVHNVLVSFFGPPEIGIKDIRRQLLFGLVAFRLALRFIAKLMWQFGTCKPEQTRKLDSFKIITVWRPNQNQKKSTCVCAKLPSDYKWRGR